MSFNEIVDTEVARVDSMQASELIQYLMTHGVAYPEGLIYSENPCSKEEDLYDHTVFYSRYWGTSIPSIQEDTFLDFIEDGLRRALKERMDVGLIEAFYNGL